MNEIEKQVLKKINPTEGYREKLEVIISELNEKLKVEIKKRKLPVEIELVGSIAKDTYLQNNMDIDFFLKFPISFSKEEIAENALSIGKSLLTDTEESYAEHPYLRGYFKNYYVEIVPCYKIEDAKQKLTAVDRTPLHTKFVKKNLKETQKKEVRLFKQFLKGIGCYGAEAQIEGFSGYLCEILVIKYGTFEELIKSVKNWKIGKKIALKEGKYPDFETPLTFIDPVDSDRNVASAVSKERFELFVKACKEYLKKPKITFFFPNEIKPWTIEKIKKEIQKENILYSAVKFEKPEIIDENLYPQIRKAEKSISEACKRADFTIYDSSFYIDDENNEIVIIIKSKNEPLTDTMIHMGPPTNVKKNSEEFINKWKNHPDLVKGPYEKNGRYYVQITRKYTEINDFLKDNVKNLSMGKHFDRIVKKKYLIVELEDLLKENFRLFWTNYLDKKMPWER
jgi:tRNA nucleotidyltransferase (CCA-adding enzyme)